MSQCKSGCRVCSRTLYSCHWEKPLETGKQKACCWFSVVAVVAVLSLCWMYICLVAFNDQEDLNWKGFMKLKLWVNWFMVLIIIAALLTSYCVLLLLFALIQVALKEPLYLHWLHKILLVCGFLLIASGVTGVSLLWNKEWLTVRLSLEATGPFLQFGVVGALTLMSPLVFQVIISSDQKFSKFSIGIIFAMVSIGIFLCPLSIHSPCFMEKQRLPNKPKLIGHRGAPMLAPENTMMSFTRSVSCGVIAFETDVQLSKDRIPILMHDNNSSFLLRTTNANEKFPNRNLTDSSNLTWAEYQSLNAGEWFIKTDPFQTVSQLSKEDKELARNQTVPSLHQLLGLAKQHNISVMFDLYSSNQGSDTIDTVNTILSSGIDPSLVLWLPPSARDYVKERAPNFIQVYNNVNVIDSNGGNHLNLKYSDISTSEISEHRNNNIEVNLWVVNERWLFSLLWCAGASSVTTNSCHLLKDMQNPDWIMSRQHYKIIWITLDVASILIMAVLFIYQWDKNRKRLIQLERERAIPLLAKQIV